MPVGPGQPLPFHQELIFRLSWLIMTEDILTAPVNKGFFAEQPLWSKVFPAITGEYTKCTAMSGSGVRIIGNPTWARNLLLIRKARKKARFASSGAGLG